MTCSVARCWSTSRFVAVPSRAAGFSGTFSTLASVSPVWSERLRVRRPTEMTRCASQGAHHLASTTQTARPFSNPWRWQLQLPRMPTPLPRPNHRSMRGSWRKSWLCAPFSKASSLSSHGATPFAARRCVRDSPAICWEQATARRSHASSRSDCPMTTARRRRAHGSPESSRKICVASRRTTIW